MIVALKGACNGKNSQGLASLIHKDLAGFIFKK